MLHEHKASSQAECNYYNSILISKGKREVTEASLLLHYHCKVSLIKKLKHCSKINETWLLYRDNPTCSFSRTYLPMMLVTIALSAACFKILWTSTLLWAWAYTYSKPQSCFMFRPVGHKCRLRHKHEVNFGHTFLSVLFVFYDNCRIFKMVWTTQLLSLIKNRGLQYSDLLFIVSKVLVDTVKFKAWFHPELGSKTEQKWNAFSLKRSKDNKLLWLSLL